MNGLTLFEIAFIHACFSLCLAPPMEILFTLLECLMISELLISDLKKNPSCNPHWILVQHKEQHEIRGVSLPGVRHRSWIFLERRDYKRLGRRIRNRYQNRGKSFCFICDFSNLSLSLFAMTQFLLELN